MPKTPSDLLRLLNVASDHIAQTSDKKEIAKIIEKLLMDFSNSDYATLFLFDASQQKLFTVDEEHILHMTAPEGITGEVFLTKKANFYNYLISEKSYSQEIDNPTRLKLKSQMVLPVVENDKLLGLVRLSRTLSTGTPYGRKDLDLLNSLHTFLPNVLHTLHADKQEQTSVDTAMVENDIKEAARHDEGLDANDTMLFLSNIVHDIRTPANSLYGFLELIEEKVEDKRLKEFIKNAKESAQFINTLTDSILAQTKEKYTAQITKPTTVHSIRFFAQIANIFSADMSSKDIAYGIYLDPMMPMEIELDELKVKRVLINLLGNAYKFTPRGQRIDFKVKYVSEEKKLKITIADKGIGINPTRQKDIFNAFEQAEQDTSEHYGGTGLGLSISAKYVKELGGKLKLKSALGEGSRFHFSIPVQIVNDAPSLQKFRNLNKHITILCDNKESFFVQNILYYLSALGMPEEHISVSSTLDEQTTHLYCFEHKLTDSILQTVQEKHIKMLAIEESLFSLSSDKRLSGYDVISPGTYCGDPIHSTTYSESKKKILIADDNKINLMLIKSMLETEYVDLIPAEDGQEALSLLQAAYSEGLPFDAIFIDKHMPSLSGSDVIREYRKLEMSQNVHNPILSISITGDPTMDSSEKRLYDLLIKKPFSTEEVRAAVAQI